MVKFKVPLKDILQNAYYQYELTSSNYNPTINNTITITCTCKNVRGNPIADKELELFQNGLSQGTQTTNANGIATWTLTMSNWGTQDIQVGNETISVYVTGFKKIAENTTYTLMVDESTRCCRIEAHRTGITIASGENFSNYGDFVIPTKYYPKSNCYSLIMRNATFLFWLWDNGSYGVINLGNKVTGYKLAFTHEWHY